MLKTICDNGKVFELLHVKMLLQNTTNDGSFQNFEFNYLERAKIANCNNAGILTDKVIGCIKSRFEDDLYRYFIQAAYKIPNAWNVMEETPKEKTI